MFIAATFFGKLNLPLILLVSCCYSKYPDNYNLREEGFALAHRSRTRALAQVPKNQGAGQMLPRVRKYRAMSKC